MSNSSNISLSGHSAKSDSVISEAACKKLSPVEEPADEKIGRRVQAVVAMLSGSPVDEVSLESGICRSDLYKFRNRALAAMREALRDEKRGPRHPHNRTDETKERKVKVVCERHPTFSSYQVEEKLKDDAPSARTIQRMRKRLRLPRLKKRAVPAMKAHRFTRKEKKLIRKTVSSKMYLGCYRLAWDLQNKNKLPINPSTTRRVKRTIIDEQNPKPAPVLWRFYERKHPHSLWHGDLFEKVTLTDEDRTAYQLTLLDDYSRAYVFCDLFREVDMLVTIRALIAAMRQYQTIPKAMVSDNGSYFKGGLVTSFCRNLGIRLIHSGVRHPQTNGKLERAFSDDRKEFYDQYDEWIFDELKRDLPEYVRYRNHVRGHLALGGRPSITRLQEQDWFALPTALERLESFARHPLEPTPVEINGCIRAMGRNGYIPGLRYREKVALTETLDGLEAETKDGRIYLLRNYRKYKHALSCFREEELPFCFEFEPLNTLAIMSDAEEAKTMTLRRSKSRP